MAAGVIKGNLQERDTTREIFSIGTAFTASPGVKNGMGILQT